MTYEITDGASTWILPRPWLGRMLATAHDMAREYRVVSALRRHRRAGEPFGLRCGARPATASWFSSARAVLARLPRWAETAPRDAVLGTWLKAGRPAWFMHQTPADRDDVIGAARNLM